MSNYTPAWTLQCPWCDWSLYVNGRGGHGGDQGAGVEAAERAQSHLEVIHPNKTWAEFLEATHDAS